KVPIIFYRFSYKFYFFRSFLVAVHTSKITFRGSHYDLHLYTAEFFTNFFNQKNKKRSKKRITLSNSWTICKKFCMIIMKIGGGYFYEINRPFSFNHFNPCRASHSARWII